MERYSYETEGPKRCGICGEKVVESLVDGTAFMADHSAPIVTKRTCTNPKCNSNTGQMMLGDVV